jgi:hypothetical protein
MKRNVKIAVGGYATKAVSDADILLHDYEDGVEGVELDTDGFDLKAFLRERVAGADKVEIYSTLSGRYSSARVPLVVQALKELGVRVNLMILTLPSQIQSFLPSDLSRPRLEIISAENARCNITFVESLRGHSTDVRVRTLADKIRELVSSFQGLSQVDAEAALSRARKILEVVVTELYGSQPSEQKTKPLFDMIEELKTAIPKRIYSYFHTIRVIGNLSAHYVPESLDVVSANDVRVIGTLVTAITEWFILQCDPDSEGKPAS